MTKRFQSRARFMADAQAALAGTEASAAAVAQVPLPADLESWLSRLRQLKGVPYQYLVPSEAMLPPESIRFFTLDPNWIELLTDGALSIGRTQSTDSQAMLSRLEAAAGEHASTSAHRAMPKLRAGYLGTTPAPAPDGIITGFLLRSDLIAANPGMGVYAFPEGHTPSDRDKNPEIEIELLEILRLETLGPQSDVLLCLISGDAFRVDIHQPPEGLHYGVDSYDDSGGSVLAQKNLHLFSVENGVVRLRPEVTKLEIGDSFRPGGQRVVRMAKLAARIGEANGLDAVDAAEMGFEMSQGVGMVSFIRGLQT